ncbi:MAG TPA: bifunctional precorrin-2 dehydrogenase/sirohydrochlorin ferrochelatase [Polyangiales bacterium]|nr:bifunctional precorrin-2 dehydrogenase/sirohydrochlorin ferrochelatase [Polyangiales bacterium]
MPSRYLPIALDVKDSACLVVGGGQVALRKVEWLRSAGASVVVIAKRACPELWELANAYALSLDERAFEDADIDRKRYALVIAATSDRGLNAHVSGLAREHRIPVNVVDAPELCSFIVPALVDRAPVTIGISTEGTSPVLARLVRRRIESVLPLELGALARFAARYRQAVKDAVPSAPARRALWERVLEGAVAQRVLSGDEQAADVAMLQEIENAQRETSTHTPYPIDVVVLPSAGIEALTLRAMRALGSADAVLFEPTTRDAVQHFGRRDAVQHELDVKSPEAIRDVLQTTLLEQRVCVVCEETSAETLFAELAREGRGFSR